MITPAPGPTPSSVLEAVTSSADPLAPWATALISGAVVAALISASVNIYFARKKTREETRERLRTLFAEAFGAYAAYREYPYAIRRRNGDKPAEERVRLSEQIRQTQERLSFYLAATAAESDEVGLAYRELIVRTRECAGVAMKEAWSVSAITTDAEMVISRKVINLASLDAPAAEYQRAVAVYLRSGRYGPPNRLWQRLTRRRPASQMVRPAGDVVAE
ncbi:hypothetical protein [Leifsonia aquatica]|uniref:hypothetical protein n=1 Tax=Leifsonia aquatica TaxID=144185 RepID=UPI0037FB44C8